MKNRLVVLITSVMLIAVFVIGSAGPASAQAAPWIKLTGGVPGLCSTGGGVVSFPFEAVVNASGSNTATLKAPGLGTVGSYAEDMTWPLSGAGYYGIPVSAFSVAANTPLTVAVTTFTEFGQGGIVSSYSELTFDCTTGATISSWFNPAGYQAEPVPTGFEQHYILCDSPVYDAPGGHHVGDNFVRAGQDWFVNPVPSSGPGQEQWTEIFVAGPNNGYIRTSCVGGPTQIN